MEASEEVEEDAEAVEASEVTRRKVEVKTVEERRATNKPQTSTETNLEEDQHHRHRLHLSGSRTAHFVARTTRRAVVQHGERSATRATKSDIFLTSVRPTVQDNSNDEVDQRRPREDQTPKPWRPTP